MIDVNDECLRHPEWHLDVFAMALWKFVDDEFQRIFGREPTDQERHAIADEYKGMIEIQLLAKRGGA